MGTYSASVTEPQLHKVRKIALALPEVNERFSHGATCFFVRDKWALCYFHDNHRGDGRVSLWCPAPPGVGEDLAGAEPARFFQPPTSASGTFSNWIGVFLDTTGDNKVDWDEIAAIVADAYRCVAPTALVAALQGRAGKSAAANNARRGERRD